MQLTVLTENITAVSLALLSSCKNLASWWYNFCKIKPDMGVRISLSKLNYRKVVDV
jgi:hypothetical protein